MALSRKELARRKLLGAERAEVAHIIRYEMKKRGYNGKKLAARLKCSGENISKVILGKGHSELVLNGLRAIGIPEAYLFDPRRSAVVGNHKVQECR